MADKHDGHIHKGKDFPVKDNRAKAGGRIIKPGSTASVDWDRIEDKALLTNNHAEDDHTASLIVSSLQGSLNLAKARGKVSKARKAQQQINLWNEGRLAIRSSWCGGCLNYLHNCQCPATADARGAAAASLDLIRRVQQDIEAKENDYRESVIDSREQRKAERRQAYRAAKKARKGKDSSR